MKFLSYLFTLVALFVICSLQIANGQPFKSNLSSSDNTSSKTMGIDQIKRGDGVIVTAPRYDNIGQVLGKIGFNYNNYQGSLTNAQMLFLNCGTSTKIASSELSEFVRRGGILYASDLTHETLIAAFPGLFNFAGTIGHKGSKNAIIVDNDLKEVLGSSMNIHFDLQNWAVLKSIKKGDILMESGGQPLMVAVPYGEGKIFYTCFHNHKQASEKEEALLQLLFAKQVQQLVQLSFGETAQQMGLDLDQMRRSIRQ